MVSAIQAVSLKQPCALHCICLLLTKADIGNPMIRDLRNGIAPWSNSKGIPFFVSSNTYFKEIAMNDAQVGWIAAIIIGGIAGWLAEQFMKSQMGLVMNIVLGIVGAAVASWLFNLLGISLGGWVGYLIAGFIGACILIFAARAIRGTA